MAEKWQMEGRENDKRNVGEKLPEENCSSFLLKQNRKKSLIWFNPRGEGTNFHVSSTAGFSQPCSVISHSYSGRHGL